MAKPKSDGKILKILKENLPLNSRSRAEVFRDRDREMSDIFKETDLDPEEFEKFIENKQNQRYFRRPIDIMRRWKGKGWLKRYGIPELSDIGEQEIYKLSTKYKVKNWFKEHNTYFVFLFVGIVVLLVVFHFDIVF